MQPISYARHQFPPVVIQHTVRLCFRFTLSYRDVEDLLAERGLEVPCETVRRWVPKVGLAIAKRLRRDEAAADKLMRKLLRKGGFAQWHAVRAR